MIDIKKKIEEGDRDLITKIIGREAETLLSELENGAGIHFKITFDNNNNPIIELHREKLIIDNIPDDKKRLNQSMY